jgi:lipopolysaccharide/colanic/teichoic acid biosynthesis glycosyltransferase
LLPPLSIPNCNRIESARMASTMEQYRPDTSDLLDRGAAIVIPPFYREGDHCTLGRRAKPRTVRTIRPATVQLRSLIRPWVEAGAAFVPAAGNRCRRYRVAKRLFDILGTLAILVLLGPVMLLVLMVLMVTTRGKPFYWQRRVGYRGRQFTMVKFRTMRPGADRIQAHVENEQEGPIFKNRRDPRITRIGRFLRKTSLDETPQLFSVLCGQMSLVGPRPQAVHEVAQFRAWQCGRLAVMPGLTCLWQVSGRSEIGFEDWVRMDLWYVRNQNFWTDCELLLRTPFSVLSGRGAY